MDYKLWINGEWTDSQGGGRMAIENPATGETIAHVVDGSREDVDRAVQAAHTAFYDGRWSKLTPSARSLAIWRLGDLLEARAAEFARAEAENTGKPYEFGALGADLPFAVDNLRFFAAAARVYVEQSRYNDVKEAVVEAMQAVKIGPQFEADSQMGPLISATQRERVQGFVNRAQANGATIVTGGGIPAGFDRGYYFEPTVICDADQKAEIIQAEVFGPVLTITPFKDEIEALHLGNDVLYGLAASVFTKDVGRAMRLTADLEFGTVWVNDHIPLTSETPHGGFKQSGFGKDLSAEAVGDYQITKHVMIANA